METTLAPEEKELQIFHLRPDSSLSKIFYPVDTTEINARIKARRDELADRIKKLRENMDKEEPAMEMIRKITQILQAKCSRVEDDDDDEEEDGDDSEEEEEDDGGEVDQNVDGESENNHDDDGENNDENNDDGEVENNDDGEVDNNDDDDVLSTVDEVQVQLGINGTLIPEPIFDAISWRTVADATRGLLNTLFDNRTLGTHTLTGKPSPAFHGRERPPKRRLDIKKVNDIIECVCKMVPDSHPRDVRAAITTKCADAAKKMRYSNNASRS